jgi:predicted transcriptional regulator of viral defense system
VIVLREDRPWLEAFSSRPKDMLRRMARRGALIELGAGRYAIPELGRGGIAFKAWQPLVDARLAPLGPYYIGFLNALADHRLTDLTVKDVTVAIGFANRQVMGDGASVAGRSLRVVRTSRPVFTEDAGIQVVEISRTQGYRRSDPMRTLVDALWHPELYGSAETWIGAWGRARRRELLDVEQICGYAQALGPSVARRTGLMLELVGQGNAARALLPSRVRRSDRPTALVADWPDYLGAERDPFWHTTFNVPRERVEGWLAYGK